MPLLKNTSYLLTDSFNNIYHILYKDGELIAVTYDSTIGKNDKRELMNNCTEYFSATIDKKNNIYVVSQNKDSNSINLFIYNSGQWAKRIINDNLNYKIYEPSIIKRVGNSHIFYFKKNMNNKDEYDFIQIVDSDEIVLEKKLFSIKTNGILNPYVLNKYKDGVLITYINSEEYYHKICLRYLNIHTNEISEEVVINEEKYEKYYLDSLVINNNNFYVTYCGKEEENYKVICDYVILNESNPVVEARAILSNLSNCMYPTLVYDRGDLWVVWYENQGVISAVKRNNSEGFQGPYLWNNSKGENILRYGYISNNKNIKARYRINYSLGLSPPDISFIGFGNLENVKEVPLKKNTEYGRDIENMTEKNINEEYVKPQKYYEKTSQNNNDDLDKYKREIEENKRLLSKLLQTTLKEKEMYEELSEKVNSIQKIIEAKATSEKDDSFEDLEKRVQDIEDYLSRRRRGGIFGPRS